MYNNRFESTLWAIAEAYKNQPASTQPEPRPVRRSVPPDERPIRSMIVDGKARLHSAFERLTRQPQNPYSALID